MNGDHPSATQDKTWIGRILPTLLRFVAVPLIAVGIVAAYYGPLEIHVFYLFSEGGRFHYDGFGMGSVWFAALVVQNLGYYLVAALCLPVGIGHLKLRRWAHTLTLLYCWFWLGAGILLFGHFLWLVPSVLGLEPDPTLGRLQVVPIAIVSFVALVVAPAVALGIYRGAAVRSVFEAHDPNRYWTERIPLPVLALLLLFGAMIIVLHLAYFFQGLFPFFGAILLGRPSAHLLALSILLLGILMVGVFRLRRWAWWGSLVTLTALTLSSALSFSRVTFYDLILRMDLPAYEIEFIDRMRVIHDLPLAGLIVVPLLIALALLIHSRRYFGPPVVPGRSTPAREAP
jgi:hypothetical protein